MVQKKGKWDDFQVFQIVQKSSVGKIKVPKDKELQDLLLNYEEVFQEELPAGLLPKRSVDHAVEIDKEAKKPLSLLYTIYPAELYAVKEYALKLLRKGKNRRSKYPFGASFFLVK